jgi:hypothetical protein
MVTPFALWPAPFDLVGTLGLFLYVILSVCLALDAADAACALAWKRARLPELDQPQPTRRVAVVMTVCDDAQPRPLAALERLADAGFAVFVLDDSVAPLALPETLAEKCEHLVRTGRTGAKAGNLNHWLYRVGHAFDYAIVLDADSSASPEACDRMLRAAAHPDNRDVAVFQTKIDADLAGSSVFAGALAVAVRARARVFERVHCRLGLLLSFGHNQLLRLCAVRDVGGFDETVSAEDTALSLALVARGWRIGIVDAWTLDRDPQTVATYNRRTLRWATQTVQLFFREWDDDPLHLKLLLCRHLAAYACPVLGFLLLVLVVSTTHASASQAWEFLTAALKLEPGYDVFGECLYGLLGAHAITFGLRHAVAIVEGAGIWQLAKAWLLGQAHLVGLVPRLALALVLTALGRRVTFTPTHQRRALESDRSAKHLMVSFSCAMLVWGPLLLHAAFSTGSLLVGFNALWLTLPFISMAALGIAERTRRLSPAKPREDA